MNGANQPIAEILSVCEQGVEENSSYLSFTVAFKDMGMHLNVFFKSFFKLRDLQLDPNFFVEAS